MGKRIDKMKAYAKKAKALLKKSESKVKDDLKKVGNKVKGELEKTAGKVKKDAKIAEALLKKTGKKVVGKVKEDAKKTKDLLGKTVDKVKELAKKAEKTQGEDGTGIKEKKKKAKVEKKSKEGALIETESRAEAAASTKTCYVVQGDRLLIGTKTELEAKVKQKVGIIELDAETKAAIEANVEIINETFKKGIEGGAKGKANAKTSAKLGEFAEVSGEVEVKAEATATAMIDLTKLMVELGVNVSVGVKIEGKASLDLKIVDVEAYISGQLDAQASASVVANWKGVTAEAKASAEAKATIGTKIKTKEFEIGGKPIKLELHPSITAFAKAEAKAKAAAGLSTGVEVGAYAAVGLRGTLEVSLIGDYTIKGGLDKMDRKKDAKGKSQAKPTTVKGKALGMAGAEISMALSVGTSFSASPYDLKIVKKDGLEYGEAEMLLHVVVPGIISGPAGVAVGLKVYVDILYEIVEDVIIKIKEAILSFVKDVIVEIIKKEYKKFKKEVEKLAKKTKEFGLDVMISVLDLIGKDLKAIDVEIKRRDDRLIDLNKVYMGEMNDSNKKKLELEFKEYNLYVEKAFTYQQEKIYKILDACEEKVDKIKAKEGNASKEERKALKKAKSQTESTMKRIKELINTKKGIIIYVKPNNNVLKLDPKIISDTEGHLTTMEETYQTLQKFVDAVG